MKHLAILLTSFLLALTSSAAVPLRWTVETSSANPATFDQFAGATYDLEAALQSNGKPLAVTGDPQLFWQTNGMGSAWWTAPATVSGNVLRATWTPACDVGAKVYNCFIGITGTVYNAAFQLRLRPSPGAMPNVLDVPPRVLDLAHTVVINPPWPTDATIDASIRRVIDEDGITAPVPTNTVKGIISNTVDKAYVESLGISGGGGGGTNTNDVKAIVDAEVGGTNEVKEAVSTIPNLVSATNEMTRSNTLKRDKTDYECYDFGQWSTTPALESGFEIRQDEHSDGFVIFDRSLGIVSTVKGDSNSISLKWGENEWTRGYEIEATRTAIRTNTLVLARRSRHASSSLAKFDEYGNLVEASPVAPSSAAEQGQAADAKATGEALDAVRTSANDANVWSMATYNFMTGGRTNCWFSGTNYVFGSDAATRTRFAWEDGMDAATVPCSMALWEIRDGTRQLVWDQKDWPTWYWSFKSAQMTADIQVRIDALGDAVTNAANYAWAKRYASDGTPNPDASTTFIDTPSVTLSPGMKWETIATVSGAAYWTIVGNGAVIGGSGTNATLRIQDFEGNDIMTVTKGENRLAWLESGEITAQMTDSNGWVCFDMLADAEPIGYFSTTLDQSDFLTQTDPGCPAQYLWENIGGGKYRVHFLLKPGIQANACFAKFQVEVEGQTVIRYNAGQEISGGLIYNGVKIAPDITGSPAVGTVIQWKVVR